MIKLNDAFSSNFSYLVTGDGVYPKVRLYGGQSDAAQLKTPKCHTWAKQTQDN